MRLCHFDRRATKWPVVEKSIKKNRFLDSASLRSPLGTPDGGNDTNKIIDYIQLVLARIEIYRFRR